MAATGSASTTAMAHLRVTRPGPFPALRRARFGTNTTTDRDCRNCTGPDPA